MDEPTPEQRVRKLLRQLSFEDVTTGVVAHALWVVEDSSGFKTKDLLSDGQTLWWSRPFVEGVPDTRLKDMLRSLVVQAANFHMGT